MIGMGTRCACDAYSWKSLPKIPGPNLGLTDKPHVGELEHRLGLHFHWCRIGGMSTQGHNAVSHAWLRALRKLGYTGEVYEVPIGTDRQGKQIRGDGVAKNFAVKATVMVWDTRISTSYLASVRSKSGKEMFVVTDYNELLKDKEKGEACKRCLQGRAEFIPIVCNSHGGLGRRAYEWLRDAFQRKVDDAADEGAKVSARLELVTALAEISCAVFQRNSMIMAANMRNGEENDEGAQGDDELAGVELDKVTMGSM
jgi:hypothetical protein